MRGRRLGPEAFEEVIKSILYVKWETMEIISPWQN